jgi:hypothetical protein
VSESLPARKKSPDKAKDIAADNKKGDVASLYIKETGKQKRQANVSIRSILLNILKINSGLISFITGVRELRLQI